jgi:hypothetical protein
MDRMLASEAGDRRSNRRGGDYFELWLEIPPNARAFVGRIAVGAKNYFLQGKVRFQGQRFDPPMLFSCRQACKSENTDFCPDAISGTSI